MRKQPHRSEPDLQMDVPRHKAFARRFGEIFIHPNFNGMAGNEGRPLLDFLFKHGNRPEFTFRFRWQKGSIAFWDNRSTKHLALGDTGPFRREMRRIQICGDRPF